MMETCARKAGDRDFPVYPAHLVLKPYLDSFRHPLGCAAIVSDLDLCEVTVTF